MEQATRTPLTFPTNPSVNDTHSHGGRTWTFNGTSWVGSTSGQQGIQGAQGTQGDIGIEGAGLFTVASEGFNYNINGYTGNFPTLTLVRGQLYYFNVNGVSESHPFALRLSNGNASAVPGTTNNNPVNGNAGTNTLITYRVPNDSPSSIIYQCTVHSNMIGTINIVNQNGEQVIQGTQGTQGRQGTTGIQGTTGSQGTTGVQGTTGSQGTTGAGTQGITGAQGTTGAQGIQGTNGAQGTQGTQGRQGTQGLRGDDGTSVTIIGS
jgi:collagen type I alpha